MTFSNMCCVFGCKPLQIVTMVGIQAKQIVWHDHQVVTQRQTVELAELGREAARQLVGVEPENP